MTLAIEVGGEVGDADLVRRIASGDVSAFELLMRRHNRRLYRLARATLRNHAEAEDALQEAYLSAYRAIGQFRGESALSTWLSRLVLNECLGRLRRKTRRDNVVPIVSSTGGFVGEGAVDVAVEVGNMSAPNADSPDEAFARTEMRALLERKIDALPDVFRTVFVLRAVEDMNVDETARCLDIPEATVRSRHFRARSMLRESLAQDLDMAERDVFEFGGAHCDWIVARVLSRLTED